MMYGSPEARICPSRCLTQKSHALRIRETSSLGRLACTWRRRASKRWLIESGSLRGAPAARTTTYASSEGVGDALGTSSGTVCRTVAMLHYRPLPFHARDSSAGRVRMDVGATVSIPCRRQRGIMCCIYVYIDAMRLSDQDSPAQRARDHILSITKRE